MANYREPNRRRSRGKRRRRVYGGSHRRRNGASLGRVRNSAVGFEQAIDIVPAATAGVWAARWAVNQAGEFEDGEPGLKHAFAIWLAASWGSELVGAALGEGKGYYAKIGALAFGGDLFMRRRFLKDSEWAKKEISLAGVDADADNTYRYDQGRDYQTMGAASMVDAMGNRYVQTDQGWALGEEDGTLYVDEDGNLITLGRLGAFENQSPLGAFENTSRLAGFGAVGSTDSSFGYARVV